MSEPQRFRVIFDGTTQINETPIGWEDTTSIIKRVKEFNALFITCEAKLTFVDDGYTYLINKYNEGFCTSVDVDLQQYVNGVYRTFFKGKIFLRDAEIQRGECAISVIVEDNTFYAKIFNNKSIEVYPFGEGTKSAAESPLNSDYALAACAYEQITLFDPNDGSNQAIAAPTYSNAAYPVYNLFEYLISFMSDNTVAFDSNLFGVGGDYEGLTVTCGIVLRQSLTVGTTEDDFKDNFEKISFKKLFEEVNKKVNIGMYIDFSNPIPVLRIERVSDVRTQATIYRALNVLGIKERIDVDALFATVRLGSSTTSDAVYTAPETGLLFPEDISFVGPKEEQFYTLANCNLDKELNLVSDWIISSNVIEDCLIHEEDSYDDELFFIMCDVSGGAYTANQQNLENDPLLFPVYYNIDLFGPAVMENYFGAIPLSIATSLGNNDNTFQSSTTTTLPTATTFYFSVSGVGTLFPLPSNDDSTAPNYDTNANYSTANFHYTAPASGLYTFYSQSTVRIYEPLWSLGALCRVTGKFIRLDAVGGTIISETTFFDQTGIALNTSFVDIICEGSSQIVVNSADVVAVEIEITRPSASFTYQIVSGAIFSCTASSDGGGEYASFDPADYPVIMHEWEYPLTYDDFETIEQNQTGQIEFARSGEVHYSGWIDSVKFKRFSDEKAKFVTYRAKRVPVTSNVDPTIQYVNVIGQLGSNPYTITTDFYGQPFGGSAETERTHFYLVGQDVTVTIPSTYMTIPVYAGGFHIVITKFSGVSSSATLVNALSATFTIEYGFNYIVQLVYSLTELGKTRPSVLPEITPPATVGTNGTLNIRCVNPATAADYTFAWNTGATTQSINVPAGNYQCTVTNTNPGTFDINTIVFDLELPVSVTGQ